MVSGEKAGQTSWQAYPCLIAVSAAVGIGASPQPIEPVSCDRHTNFQEVTVLHAVRVLRIFRRLRAGSSNVCLRVLGAYQRGVSIPILSSGLSTRVPLMWSRWLRAFIRSSFIRFAACPTGNVRTYTKRSCLFKKVHSVFSVVYLWLLCVLSYFICELPPFCFAALFAFGFFCDRHGLATGPPCLFGICWRRLHTPAQAVFTDISMNRLRAGYSFCRPFCVSCSAQAGEGISARQSEILLLGRLAAVSCGQATSENHQRAASRDLHGRSSSSEAAAAAQLPRGREDLLPLNERLLSIPATAWSISNRPQAQPGGKRLPKAIVATDRHVMVRSRKKLISTVRSQ